MIKHITTAMLLLTCLTSSVFAGDPVYDYTKSGNKKVSTKTYIQPGFPGQQPVIKVAPPVDDWTPAPLLGFSGTMIQGHGLKVNSVNSWSKAERIGLEANDVIESINGVTITSHHQYQHLLREALQYNDGYVSMRVHNSRPWPAPQHVTINFRLDEATGVASCTVQKY